MTARISLSEKFALFAERWWPKTIAAVNGQEVNLVKVKGEFRWHHHDDAEEFFMFWRGRCPVEFLCFEPASIGNTGNVRDAEFTATTGVAI
jgi:mannose-6-phosphate isomerase-like protein (cupin superfamily)